MTKPVEARILIPADMHAKLKQRAAENFRSMTSQILADISYAMSCGTQPPVSAASTPTKSPVKPTAPRPVGRPGHRTRLEILRGNWTEEDWAVYEAMRPVRDKRCSKPIAADDVVWGYTVTYNVLDPTASPAIYKTQSVVLGDETFYTRCAYEDPENQNPTSPTYADSRITDRLVRCAYVNGYPLENFATYEEALNHWRTLDPTPPACWVTSVTLWSESGKDTAVGSIKVIPDEVVELRESGPFSSRPMPTPAEIAEEIERKRKEVEDEVYFAELEAKIAALDT